MIVEAADELARRAVRSLNTHDFAFIRRFGGSYLYAILAYRSVEPIGRGGAAEEDYEEDHGTMEECMTFVVDEGRSTKMMRERHWEEYVCLVSTEGSCRNPAAGACSSPKAVVPVEPPASCKIRLNARIASIGSDRA